MAECFEQYKRIVCSDNSHRKILSQVTKPITGPAEIRGRVRSLLKVDTGCHPELTGRENVYLNGAMLGMTEREIDPKLDEIFNFAEVEDLFDTPAKRYSSGFGCWALPLEQAVARIDVWETLQGFEGLSPVETNHEQDNPSRL